MTRAIELRPDFAAAPNASDVAKVAGWMLWPAAADDELRARALTAVAIDLALASGSYPEPDNAAERRQLMEIIRTAPQPSDYEDAIKNGFRRGMVAGSLLRTALKDPGKVKLGPLKAKMAERFSRNRERVSQKTIEGIWRDYRCVAHYWAAHIEYCRATKVETIPCGAADLVAFLRRADDLRRAGEAARTPRSPEPSLLRPGEAIAISAGI